MNASELQWTPGPAESTRCTQTVLMQFGIFDRVPHSGAGVLQALQEAGYGYTDVEFVGTVQRFVAEYPTGRFYIFSSGHAMAVIDGLLVDSEDAGPNRRRVLGAYRIEARP